ncbi:MAG TPA: hypothetical protein VFG19_11590 [Geobacteraceae bacterium]|nr:hypothetical protein [Geobacteraceae bacterium]
MRKVLRRISMILPVLCLVITTGCAWLYNPSRDKQGQTVVKAASDIKPLETVTAMEQRYAGLLDLEADATRQRFQNIRDGQIKTVVFTNNNLRKTLLDPIKARLNQIGGKFDSIAMNDMSIKLQINSNKIASRRDDLIGVALPTCEDLLKNKGLTEEETGKIPKDSVVLVRQTVQDLLTLCAEREQLLKNYDEALGKPASEAEMAAAERQLSEDQDGQTVNDSVRKEVTTRLEALKKQYDDAARDKKDPEYQKKVQEAGKNLTKALEALEKAQGAVGLEVLAEEKVKRLDEVIAAIADNNVDTAQWSADLKKSVAIAGAIPALADSTEKALADAQAPRLAPLVIVRQHYQELVTEANEVKTVLDNRVNISRKLVTAYIDEGRLLDEIRIGLEQNHPSWLNQSFVEVSKKIKPEEKFEFYEMVGKYFGDAAKLQADEKVLEYQRLSTFYDEDFIRSKHAVVMWQNMVEGIASVLAQYHSSGIKADELARFIEAAGIISIGVGVNR